MVNVHTTEMAKKITQNDLRRLMSQKKNDILQIAKKIDSPLAKYPLLTD